MLARLAVLLAIFLALAQPAHADGHRVEDHFSADDIARAEAYNGPRYLLRFGALGIELALLAVLGLGGGARRLAAWSARVTPRPVVRAVLLTIAITAAVWLVLTPLWLARHTHERRFGLATDTAAQAFRDRVAGLFFMLVVTAIATAGAVWVARRAGSRWPIALWVAGSGFLALMVFVVPVVYDPVFNRFTPVDARTGQMVREIAARAGVPVGDVLEVDASRRTTRHNAYVTGLGATKRVVLYDTLLREADPRTVRLVVAHELAHVAHHDVRNNTLLGVAGLALGIAALWGLLKTARGRRIAGGDSPGDPALMPFLVLFIAVCSTVALPAENAISRSHEARADRMAIALTKDPAAAVRLEVDIARRNIADLRPNPLARWMFFTHPSVMERIRIAREAGG